MILEPTSSWMIRPAVMIGPVPSYMTVPRDEAMIMRAQYSGSAPVAALMPYRGSWEHTRKMARQARVVMNLFLRGSRQLEAQHRCMIRR